MSKYLCAARYDAPTGRNATCGGRVRTYGFICPECEQEERFQREMRREKFWQDVRNDRITRNG